MQINVDDMKRKLGDEYALLLRVHPLAVKGLNLSLFDDDFIFNVTNYPYVEELYLISDICITDYSSVMFDYAILNRPMLFYVYDLEDYRDTLRGFNFDFEAEAPGPLLKSSEEVIEAVANLETIQAKFAPKLERFRSKYCQFENGTACKQIFEEVIKGK